MMFETGMNHFVVSYCVKVVRARTKPPEAPAAVAEGGSVVVHSFFSCSAQHYSHQPSMLLQKRMFSHFALCEMRNAYVFAL